jgi:hypothetical protein
MHSSYLHRLRLGFAEAMMKRQQHAQRLQLDLLVLANSETQRQRLDPMIRADVTGLLKLLLDECSTVEATEAADE